MSARLLPVCLAAALLGAAAPVLAAPSGAPARVVTATYQVADLVVPVDKSPRTIALHPVSPCQTTACRPAAPKCTTACVPPPAEEVPTTEDRLIKLIVTTIAPQSWDSTGGPGTINYYPLGKALIVNQTQDVQEQIADLLAALRRLDDQEVVLEFRIIGVADDFLKQSGADWPAATSSPDAAPARILDDKQAHQFMEAIQADQRTCVQQAPKVTLFDGQPVDIDLTDKQFFVTGVGTVEANGQICFVPKSEPHDIGMKLSARPTVSADRRFVQLSLRAEQTELASAVVPLTRVCTAIAPQKVDGIEGEPVVHDQYLQQPRFDSHALEVTLAIPEGGTALIPAWRYVHETRNESGPPVLSKIPYVNRLFKNVGYGREPEQVLLMVTSRVIVSEEEEEKVAATPCPRAESAAGAAEESDAVAPEKKPAHTIGKAEKARAKKVARLLKKYHQACADGRMEDAGRLARMALKVDPACFDK